MERKAIILGRKAKLLGQDMDLTRVGLVADQWIGKSKDILFSHLSDLNEQTKKDFAEAALQGHKLRFTARVTNNKVVVGLSKLASETAIGQLKGTDNIVVIHSKRYHDRPLVVIGPGAGPTVTAMGVLGDLLRIAAERA